MHLLEKLVPVSPISFRKQTFCPGRHRSSLLRKKTDFKCTTLSALEEQDMGLKASQYGCAVGVQNK